mgnify:CR=1 FL=1
MSILEVSGLRKVYTSRLGGSRVEALRNVSFTVEQGEYVAIMGESGSGKTTLLNILAALDEPTAGTVRLDGHELGKIREKDAAAFRRDNLGFVFQEFNLLDTFTLEDNIYLPLVLMGMSYEDMRARLLPIARELVKALAAGGDCVMIGSMFAGTEEAPGETIIYNGRKFKTYRGMGSIDAMKAGSADRYFQKGCEGNINKLVPEGIVARVPFKGTLSEAVFQLIGGIRSGMGYCGARDIAALQRAQFIRITSNGVTENHPHDVTITSETPNYSRGE